MDELRHGLDEHARDEAESALAEAAGTTPDEWAAVADRLSAYGELESANVDDEPDQERGHLAAAEPEETTSAAEEIPAADADMVASAVVAAPDRSEDAPQHGGRRRSFRRRSASSDSSGERKSEREVKSRRAPKKDKKARKLVGLKIGASQIAAARIENNGAPELVEVVREPLAPGIVTAGEIRDPDALADALENFFSRHKLPRKGVRLGLSNNRIGVRVFEIEGVMDPRQLENAIRFRAEEVLPIPLDQAVLDYVVLDDGARDGVPVRRILLVVAYREAVERYLVACRAAGLDVVGVDLEAFALLRSLASPSDEPPRGGALVAAGVGHDRTTIAVSTGRNCEFARVLDWGGSSLSVAIARELDLAPSEVEQIKLGLSFTEETVVEGLDAERASKARDAMQRSLAAFARELVASLHFYQAQPGALGIGEILVTGGTAHAHGFPEALARQIGVPVALGDPFRRVKVGRKVASADSAGSLAVAIGLGIED